MNELCLSDKIRIIYIENGKIPETISRGYCVYYVKTDDGETISELRKKDYVFADRLMAVEIALSGWEPIYYDPSKQKGIRYECIKDWSVESIYELTKGDFTTDRRFAVSMQTDNAALREEILYNYIYMLRESGFMASLCYKESALVGFNLWNIHDNNIGTILLGVVESKVRTFIAPALYEFTLYTMKHMGVNKLSNRVSTCNVSAIRLHMALGRNINQFKITGFEDQYIKEELHETDVYWGRP